VRVLIVEDGTQRGALAAVRSLGAAGHEVGVASQALGHAARSRWCTRWHRIPPPAHPTEPFAEAIRELAVAHGYEVAFGVGDAEVLALSKHRDLIGCELGYAEHEVVEAGFDKVVVSELAVAEGIRVPERLSPRDDVLPFPVIVKERLHGPETAEATSMRVFATRANDPDELSRAVDEIESRNGEAVVEECVDGLLEAIFFYAHEGRIYACGRSIADRVYPAGAGASTRSITAPLDPGLMANIENLILKMRWSGVAQLQFLRAPGAEPKFIDFNGRFYGSLALAIDAGVDLPLIWLDAIAGRLPRTWTVAAPGARYQWLEGDLRRALREPRDRRWREVAVALVWASRRRHSIWRWNDPGPAVRHLGVLGGRFVTKGFRWISRRSSTGR
jgi:predicted ATP-grasp superfamily ATP-dependent carboligase